jgi:hypothetical protein
MEAIVNFLLPYNFVSNFGFLNSLTVSSLRKAELCIYGHMSVSDVNLRLGTSISARYSTNSEPSKAKLFARY